MIQFESLQIAENSLNFRSVIHTNINLKVVGAKFNLACVVKTVFEEEKRVFQLFGAPVTFVLSVSEAGCTIHEVFKLTCFKVNLFV